MSLRYSVTAISARFNFARGNELVWLKNVVLLLYRKKRKAGARFDFQKKFGHMREISWLSQETCSDMRYKLDSPDTRSIFFGDIAKLILTIPIGPTMNSATRRLAKTMQMITMSGVLLFSVAHQSQAQDPDKKNDPNVGWTELFNGIDLNGWEQKNGTAKYSVVAGTILGETSVGSPNSFLCTTKEHGDFELRFEVKVDNGLNSGVQIRSKTSELDEKQKGAGVKYGRVNGPQVEIEMSGGNGAKSGYVYGEATGRGWLTPSKRLRPHKHFVDGEWNSYRIVARGSRIQTWINGQPIEDLTDDPSYLTHPRGFIGLQVHGIGANVGPFQVQWRNIRIREITNSITHSFIGFGKANRTVIVDEQGNVVWKLDLPASDGWVLPNGNVLIALYKTEEFPNGGVIEVDRNSKQILWQYQGQQNEISTVQPLENGTYLVAELGPEPRAIVIDRQGQVLKTMPLQCQKGNAHMQTRMLRRLPNGNYIAPHLLDFAVKEYVPETGEVLRVFATDDRGREKKDWPFTAIRLDNGNTVIGCTNGNRVIEIDENGKIVWSVNNEDLGENLISDACGVQRLPNGNTVITSYHASGDQVKLFEVTPEKKVVWRFSDAKAGFHHFQILTTNGRPQPLNTWK